MPLVSILPPQIGTRGNERIFFLHSPLLLCRAVLCYFSETFCFSIIILFGYNKVNFISSQFLITDSTLKVQKISRFDSFSFEMLMECFFNIYFRLRKKIGFKKIIKTVITKKSATTLYIRLTADCPKNHRIVDYNVD